MAETFKAEQSLKKLCWARILNPVTVFSCQHEKGLEGVLSLLQAFPWMHMGWQGSAIQPTTPSKIPLTKVVLTDKKVLYQKEKKQLLFFISSYFSSLQSYLLYFFHHQAFQTWFQPSPYHRPVSLFSVSVSGWTKCNEGSLSSSYFKDWLGLAGTNFSLSRPLAENGIFHTF